MRPCIGSVQVADLRWASVIYEEHISAVQPPLPCHCLLFPSPSDRVRLDTWVSDKEKCRRSVSGDTKVLYMADRGYRRAHSQTNCTTPYQGIMHTSGSRYILTRMVKNFHEPVTGICSFGVWPACSCFVYIRSMALSGPAVPNTFDENVFRGQSKRRLEYSSLRCNLSPRGKGGPRSRWAAR